MPSNPSVSGLANSLHKWGIGLKSALLRSDWSDWSSSIAAKNSWFDPHMLQHALEAWANALQPALIDSWLSGYCMARSPETDSKNVGLILPGNIPLAGLHDVLCTLISGHRALVKTSSDDAGLIEWALQELFRWEPAFQDRFEHVDKIQNVDAMIATGSNSTLPYFTQYFGHLPHLFRTHRNSMAILHGKETLEQWSKLSQDIFLYYGKGCRNVTKLLVPDGTPPETLLNALGHFPFDGQHFRYRSNLDYQLALHMLNRTPYYHNGSVILRQNSNPSTPISVLHFDYYQSGEDLARKVLLDLPHTQCYAGDDLVNRWGSDPSFRKNFGDLQWNSWCYHAVDLGLCQKPELNCYADGKDTMVFLLGL